MVGDAGFEPATLRSQSECSTRLSQSPILLLHRYPLGVYGETMFPLFQYLTIFSLHTRSSILAAARLGIFIVLPAATFRIRTSVCVIY